MLVIFHPFSAPLPKSCECYIHQALFPHYAFIKFNLCLSDSKYECPFFSFCLKHHRSSHVQTTIFIVCFCRTSLLLFQYSSSSVKRLPSIQSRIGVTIIYNISVLIYSHCGTLCLQTMQKKKTMAGNRSTLNKFMIFPKKRPKNTS